MLQEPYTEIGIKRLTCCRKGCNNKAAHQWQICSDDNTYRPTCVECDIEMNRLILEFMGFDDISGMMSKYRQTKEAV